MKRIVFLLILCVFITGCSQSSATRNYDEHCPVCGESVEFEIEPDDAIRWLNKEGYDVIRQEDLWEYVFAILSKNND